MKSTHADQVTGLADTFGPLVFATAYRILGNRDEADDAYQEVFLRLVKSPKGVATLDRPEAWGAYLRVMATRCAINILKRRPRWELAGEGVLETLAAPGAASPRALAAQNERAELLRRALSALPERDARVFTLRLFEGLSYEEIAEAEELTTSAVGVILHRTGQRLRRALDPLADGPAPARSFPSSPPVQNPPAADPAKGVVS